MRYDLVQLTRLSLSGSSNSLDIFAISPGNIGPCTAGPSSSSCDAPPTKVIIWRAGLLAARQSCRLRQQCSCVHWRDTASGTSPQLCRARSLAAHGSTPQHTAQQIVRSPDDAWLASQPRTIVKILDWHWASSFTGYSMGNRGRRRTAGPSASSSPALPMRAVRPAFWLIDEAQLESGAADERPGDRRATTDAAASTSSWGSSKHVCEMHQAMAFCQHQAE